MPTIQERLNRLNEIGAQSERIVSGSTGVLPQTSSGSSIQERLNRLSTIGKRSEQIIAGMKSASSIGGVSKDEFSKAKTPLLLGYDERADDYDGLFGTLRGVGESALAGIRSANEALAGWLADVTPDAVKENISLVDVDQDAARAAASAASGAVQERFGRTEGSQEQGRERQQQATDYLTQRRNELDTGADVERLFEEAANSQEEAARIREYTVGDNGAFAQLLFDAGVGGVQMGYDALMNFLIPGSGLASAGLRGAGSGILEAQQSGASTLQQLAYGLGVGAVEAATEKISNLAGPLRRVFGGGVADRAITSLVNRLTSSTAGRAVLNLAANAAGEGFEEFVSSVANPTLRRIFDENAFAEYGDPQMWADAAYDALVGATIGGVLGGAGQVIENRANRRASQNVENNAPAVDSAGADVTEGNVTTRPTESAVEAPATSQAVPEVEQVLASGNVSNSVAERIINTPELRAQFEALTGQQLTGTKSEMRSAIKRTAAQMREQASVDNFLSDAAEATGQTVAQAANVSEIPNSSPVQNVNAPVMPDSSAVNPESSVGAMARGATVGHTPTYAENQEHALEGALGEQYEGPGVHEVLPNQDSMFYAQQRLDADYEGEVSDLRSKQEWDAIDTDAGFLILQQLSQKAMESNSETDISALRDWSNLVRSRATTAGQTLQAYSKWRQFTPENAYADAVDILYGDNVRRGMTEEQKQTILKETKNASERLESIAPEDVENTIDLIKSLSQQRRTTGLLRNDTSDVMNAALQQVAQQEGGAEFLRSIAQSQIRRLAEDYERVSFTERMRTLRALNMLSKPATTLRNLVGNTVFDPLESISNNTGLAFDWLLSLYTGQRTTAMDKSWFSEAKRRGSVDALMRSIVEVGLDADATGATNRYEQGGGRTFRMTGNFIERLLSTWEKFNGYALTSTDEFAKGGTRAEAERGLRELAERGLLVDVQEAQAAQRKRGNNILQPGTVVRALDRNNFGHVVAYDPEADSYLIHFESREGAEADVELPASQVVDTKAAGRVSRRITGGRDSRAAQRAQLTTDEYIAQRADEIAKQRTFQNDSIASDVTLGLRDVGNIIHYGDIGVGDVLVPFARVPANVATQAINYSPAGLANGVVQTARVLRAAHNGTLTPQQQAAAVMSLGRGLAGTTGIALFAGLALKGILNVAGADDDDERAFDTGEGLSGTQLNLSALERWISGESTEWQDGDTLLSIGFLEPINAQMAMGAMIADSYVEDGTLTGNDILESTASGVMQSIIDLPAMSSIQELLDSWEYASGDTNVTRAVNAAMSFAGSQLPGFVVPNLVAGIASGLDNTVRAPYLGETAEDDLINQFLADIPGLRENVPARLDSWGNERTYSDSDVLNFLNSTILPGSVTQYHTNSVNQEIRRLGNFPQRSAPGDFSIDGEKITLTQEQKDAYQQAYGDAALSVLEPLMASSTYQSLSDEEKNKVIDSVYEYANAAAKQTVDNRYKLEGAAAKASEYDNPGEYFLFNEAWKVIEDSKGANTAAFEAVMQDYERMSAQKQNALMEALGEGTRFDDVVDAYEAGIEPERWYEAYDEWRAIDGGEGSATDKATQFAQWLETEGGYSENESNLLQDQLAYYSMIRGNAERYDELRDFGFSPQESYNLYEAIGEMNAFKADKDENGDSISGSKKAKVIAFIDALNLTPAEKDILFNEFTTYTGLEDTPWH